MKTETKPLLKHGWLRALLYILIIVALLFAFDKIASAISFNELTGESVGVANTLNEHFFRYALLSAAILLVTWLFRKFVDKENFKSLGFEWKGFEADAGVGFFTGAALLGIGTIILAIAGYLTFIGYSFNPSSLLFEILFLVIVAFTEEIIFRGYILHNLLKSMNKWVALIISAVLFALFHAANPDVSALSLINIFFAGFLFGINYIFTRNLWFAIFFHFSWNFFEGPVFGYEVSGLDLQGIFEQTLSGPELLTGGEFGFEGSLLCPALTVFAAIIYGIIFYRKYNSTHKVSAV